MATVLPSDPPPLPLARFSVEQYHRMVDSGAFSEDDRLELIDGWVVRKMAKGPAHEFSTGCLEDVLRNRIPTGWHVRNQAPITLPGSEPEPDLAIVRGSRSDYRGHHPGGADVALVVEVSDTSLVADRLKGKLYSAAKIAHYWIVNLPDQCVEAYSHPAGTAEQGYGTCSLYRPGDQLRLVIGSGEYGSLEVTDLMP